MNLPPELSKIKIDIEKIARGYGLDFFDTIFSVVSFKQMNEVASYGGFPTRYPHWSFGMEYERMSKGYRYGLQKIYEIVINNDPCYAYLLESNTDVDQKLVIAHVYGHCDFFKNNMWFSMTTRNMLDEMANHGTRVRRYIEKYGLEKVEAFLDVSLSIEDLVDCYSIFFPEKRSDGEIIQEEGAAIKKIPSKGYMDRYINPKDFIETMRKKADLEREKKRKIPAEPEKDILLFLIEYAPIEKWEMDILSIIREESYYFAPQKQTKIMNEGWATYWHSKIMTNNVLTDKEVIDYADHHSSTVAQSSGSLNPYKLGFELWKNIEERWNKGKFGKDYDECDDMRVKREWDKKLGLGREKIFETRKACNDITFIDNFLTEEFCKDHKMFTYSYNNDKSVYEISARDFKKIKDKILYSLTNFGKPYIYAENANYKNRGELYLIHKHEGINLQIDYAQDTLKNIHQIWKRPVNLETKVGDKPKLLTYNGKEFVDNDI